MLLQSPCRLQLQGRSRKGCGHQAEEGDQSGINICIRVGYNVGGSKLEAGNRDGLDLLNVAVRICQCCCDRLASFGVKVVVSKAVKHQAEEGDQRSGINICILYSGRIKVGTLTETENQYFTQKKKINVFLLLAVFRISERAVW